jgi:hypothetical protein
MRMNELGLCYQWQFRVGVRQLVTGHGVDAAWLVVTRKDGGVRIWDAEFARCIARLHASVDAGDLDRIWISRDEGRVIGRKPGGGAKEG